MLSPNPQGTLALKDIADLAEVSRAAVSNWRARYADSFPEPVPLSTPRRPLFDAQEVLTWLTEHDLLPAGIEDKKTSLRLRAILNTLANEGLNPGELAKFALQHLAGESSESSELVAIFDGLSTEKKSVLASLVLEHCFGNQGRGSFGMFSTSSSRASSILASAASTSVTDSSIIFDPTCGIGETLIQAGRAGGKKLRAQDTDPFATEIVSLRKSIGEPRLSVKAGDFLTTDTFGGDRPDVIVAELPFGMRIDKEQRRAMERTKVGANASSSNGDAAFLARIVDVLADEGRGYALTPLAPAFQGPLRKFRSNLIAHGCVEFIFQLPPRLLTNTSIPTLLWVLRSPNAVGETPTTLIDASQADNRLEQIGSWITSLRKGEHIDVPHVSVSLAEFVTSEGSLLPSEWLFEALSEQEVANRLKELESEINAISKKLDQPIRLTFEHGSFENPILISLREAIERKLIKILDLRPKDKANGETKKVPKIASINLPEPELVEVPADEECARSGDIVALGMRDSALVPGTSEEWAVPNFAKVIRVLDSKLSPRIVKACIDHKMRERRTAAPGVLTPGTVLRGFLDIEIPLLTDEQLAELDSILRELDERKQLADKLGNLAAEANDALIAATLLK
ncbi:N-6 DNA methylase [Corynebacterium hindlerae]|uniref:site-specific DNA-methyltransferase (adenine-specific) n=1 Tax=Corynebacterium hindlerae TaxID=699041 RepID=A0A7G5FC64_9CORY|nr:N-6 DNA methylase [Corynebacterium hindlerae]QMV84205.1 N-6 DNA methylase [Corynebacterium hindlerae]